VLDFLGSSAEFGTDVVLNCSIRQRFTSFEFIVGSILRRLAGARSGGPTLTAQSHDVVNVRIDVERRAEPATDASLPSIYIVLQMAGMKIRRISRIFIASAYPALMIGMVTSIAGCGGSSGGGLSPNRLLPGNYVVLLNIVNQYFDSITREDSTGEDSTAQGNPNATRAVFFIGGANTQKVTITVDRYRTTADAASAYQAALEKSAEVPGFTPISIPAVGRQSFAGSVTQGMETHVGLGALDGTFVFGATLAGFDATPDNVDNLVGLTRAENAAIDAASGQ
jgi:hypothetical protein